MADKTERLEGPKYFAGNVQFSTVNMPTGTNAAVGDAEVKTGAKIDASKLRRRMHARYSQGNVAAVSETRVLHIAYGAVGEVKAVRVSNIARATGNSTVTVNVRKNGTTILTGVITLTDINPGSATYGVAVGTVVSSPANSYVAGDVFDCVIVATVGTGTLPTGLSIDLMLDEDPQ